MHTTQYRVEVKLSKAEAWDKLRDLSLAAHYVPGVTDVQFTTDLKQGVGASRTVHQGERLALDETVVEWADGEGFSLRLHRGDKGPLPPLAEAYFDYGLEQRGDSIYLHNRMRYSVSWGMLGKLLDRLLLRRVVAGALRDTTISQKLFYEGGETITPQLLKVGKLQLTQ